MFVSARELPSRIDILTFIVEHGLATSKTAAKQLLQEGAIKINGEKISKRYILVYPNDLLKVGRHQFLRFDLARKKGICYEFGENEGSLFTKYLREDGISERLVNLIEQRGIRAICYESAADKPA